MYFWTAGVMLVELFTLIKIIYSHLGFIVILVSSEIAHITCHH